MTHGSDSVDQEFKVVTYAGVVNVYLKHNKGEITRSPERLHEETIGLALSVGLEVKFSQIFHVPKLRSGTLISQTKIDFLKEQVQEHDLGVLVLDGNLSPVQQRNLEKKIGVKVIDRTGLILEIFGLRARTREGVLQVELAQLEYQKTRLVRSWTHLERQRGGLGFVGGAGEKQLEIDRRLISQRIQSIKKSMQTVVKTRELHRKNRERKPYPTVALVGYTNAGKSTLFNFLTGSNVLAQDMLFATLDPTMRSIQLPYINSFVILSDTVGFISNLPTGLIAAFRATLEEVCAADIILIVSDVSDPEWREQYVDVVKILKDLGIETDTDNGKAIILDVYNKVDALPEAEGEAIKEFARRDEKTCAVSAITGDGIEDLCKVIQEKLSKKHISFQVSIPVSDGSLSSWVFQNSTVTEQFIDDTFIHLTITMSIKNIGRLKKKAKEIIPKHISTYCLS